MTTRELIERYNGGWNEHDLDAILALHAPDMVFENHTAGERAEGDDVRRHIAGIFEAWPDLSFDTRRLYANPDHAVCEWTATATHQRPLRRGDLVAEPTGRRISCAAPTSSPSATSASHARTSTRTRSPSCARSASSRESEAGPHPQAAAAGGAAAFLSAVAPVDLELREVLPARPRRGEETRRASASGVDRAQAAPLASHCYS